MPRTFNLPLYVIKLKLLKSYSVLSIPWRASSSSSRYSRPAVSQAISKANNFFENRSNDSCPFDKGRPGGVQGGVCQSFDDFHTTLCTLSSFQKRGARVPKGMRAPRYCVIVTLESKLNFLRFEAGRNKRIVVVIVRRNLINNTSATNFNSSYFAKREYRVGGLRGTIKSKRRNFVLRL